MYRGSIPRWEASWWSIMVSRVEFEGPTSAMLMSNNVITLSRLLNDLHRTMLGYFQILLARLTLLYPHCSCEQISSMRVLHIYIGYLTMLKVVFVCAGSSDRDGHATSNTPKSKDQPSQCGMWYDLSCIHTVYIIHTYYTLSYIVYLHLWFYLLNDDNSMMIHLHASLTGGAPGWDQGWLGIQTLARAVQPVIERDVDKMFTLNGDFPNSSCTVIVILVIFV